MTTIENLNEIETAVLNQIAEEQTPKQPYVSGTPSTLRTLLADVSIDRVFDALTSIHGLRKVAEEAERLLTERRETLQSVLKAARKLEAANENCEHIRSELSSLADGIEEDGNGLDELEGMIDDARAGFAEREELQSDLEGFIADAGLTELHDADVEDVISEVESMLD